MSTTITQFSRGQVQDLLTRFAFENPSYRDALVNDPRPLIERQFGVSLGAVNVKTVVETPDTVYLVLPYQPADGELPDRDLEVVAGGKGDPNINASYYAFGGSFNTVNQVAI